MVGSITLTNSLFGEKTFYATEKEASDQFVLVEKTITDNGTYLPEDDNADGYSKVVVTVE